MYYNAQLNCYASKCYICNLSVFVISSVLFGTALIIIPKRFIWRGFTVTYGI